MLVIFQENRHQLRFMDEDLLRTFLKLMDRYLSELSRAYGRESLTTLPKLTDGYL